MSDGDRRGQPFGCRWSAGVSRVDDILEGDGAAG